MKNLSLFTANLKNLSHLYEFILNGITSDELPIYSISRAKDDDRSVVFLSNDHFCDSKNSTDEPPVAFLINNYIYASKPIAGDSVSYLYGYQLDCVGYKDDHDQLFIINDRGVSELLGVLSQDSFKIMLSDGGLRQLKKLDGA